MKAGAMWYATYAHHHSSRLGMRHPATGSCAFVKHAPDDSLESLSVVKVEDTVLTGTESFFTEEDREAKAFLSKGRPFIGSSRVKFNSTCISKTNDGYQVDQRVKTTRLNMDFPRTPDIL